MIEIRNDQRQKMLDPCGARQEKALVEFVARHHASAIERLGEQGTCQALEEAKTTFEEHGLSGVRALYLWVDLHFCFGASVAKLAWVRSILEGPQAPDDKLERLHIAATQRRHLACGL